MSDSNLYAPEPKNGSAKSYRVSAGALLLAMSFSSMVHADDEGSKFLIEGCRQAFANLTAESKHDVGVGEMFCSGYLRGFRNASQAENSKLYCIPAQVSAAQLITVYVKWTDDMPNARSLSNAFTVAGALHAAFSCK
jgi:Rap1a immunity proteins